MLSTPLDVPKVPFSHDWMAAMHLQHHINADANGISPDEQAILSAVRAYDWTLSNDYCCSLLSKSPASSSPPELLQSVLRARHLQAELSSLSALSIGNAAIRAQPMSSGRWEVRRAGRSGVDDALLRRRDLPILFYDELLLFQDDLEDCGEVSMEAKLRVMPGCWFLLCKLFLRVDGKLARCRETRLFHALASASCAAPEAGHRLEVHMEVVWRESALAASQSCSKAASNELPVVNEAEGIHQFYTLVNHVM
jgi:hypothetical protein